MSAENVELAAIARALTAARRQLDQELEEIFVELQRVDPELAAALVRAFGSGSAGLHWLTQRPLRGKESPSDLLRKGKREEVLDQVIRIEHCVYC